MATVARKRGTKTAFPCPHCGKDVDLVGTREAVELLGVKPSTFQSWRERNDDGSPKHGFPEPVWDAGQGALWLREDVVAWHENRNRETSKQLAEKLAVNLEGMDDATAEETLQALLSAMEAKRSKAAR